MKIPNILKNKVVAVATVGVLGWIAVAAHSGEDAVDGTSILGLDREPSELEILAGEGDPVACFHLGMAHYYGATRNLKCLDGIMFEYILPPGKEKEDEVRLANELMSSDTFVPLVYEAGHWLLEAAKQDYGPACGALGLIYTGSEIAPKNLEFALAWFRRGASLGDQNCILNLACFNPSAEEPIWDYNSEWYDNALPKLAEQGNPAAMKDLALHYEWGRHRDKDPKKAFEWMSKSARAGHVGGMHCLSGYYLDGTGMEKDVAEAIRWAKKAAERGNEEGMCNLGAIFWGHFGDDWKNDEEAARWDLEGAKRGQATCALRIFHFYRDGKGGLSQDYATAHAWLDRSIQWGDSWAMNEKGICYQMGVGVAVDLNKATAYYSQAADAGNETARNNLNALVERHPELLRAPVTPSYQGFGQKVFCPVCFGRGHTSSGSAGTGSNQVWAMATNRCFKCGGSGYVDGQ